jgi:hypothetical protein
MGVHKIGVQLLGYLQVRYSSIRVMKLRAQAAAANPSGTEALKRNDAADPGNGKAYGGCELPSSIGPD